MEFHLRLHLGTDALWEVERVCCPIHPYAAQIFRPAGIPIKRIRARRSTVIHVLQSAGRVTQEFAEITTVHQTFEQPLAKNRKFDERRQKGIGEFRNVGQSYAGNHPAEIIAIGANLGVVHIGVAAKW